MLNRLQQRGGLPALATHGLLTRASEVSGGQFLQPDQGDYIGPYSATPVWGSSLGALGPDTELRLAPTLGPVSHPLLAPLTLGLPRLDNLKLLRSLRLLELCSWADLTTRAPDGSRTWLDLPTLLPDLTLFPFPPVPQPWPGDPASTRPGHFWRLARGPGDWAWGGIHQIIAYLPTENVLSLQRWTEGHHRSLNRSGHSFTTTLTDFTDRCSHRVLVQPSRSPGKGTLCAEFPDTPQLTPSPGPSWVDALRQLDPAISWSIYTDASWRAVRPPQAQAVFGLQGSHHGHGALFITVDHPDWCSDILALHFEIPSTPPSLGGTAQVAELLAIQAGLHLLHSRHLRGTVYSDCLGAVKKISRRWSTGRSFSFSHGEPGCPLRTHSTQMDQGPSGALGRPAGGLDPATMGDLYGGRVGQIPEHWITPLLANPVPPAPDHPLPHPPHCSPPRFLLALGRPGGPSPLRES